VEYIAQEFRSSKLDFKFGGLILSYCQSKLPRSFQNSCEDSNDQMCSTDTDCSRDVVHSMEDVGCCRPDPTLA